MPCDRVHNHFPGVGEKCCQRDGGDELFAAWRFAVRSSQLGGLAKAAIGGRITTNPTMG
jgi:hypothetical protein